MWRYIFCGLAMTIALVLSRACAYAADEASRPNIVIILADDLGYADIGAQGVATDVRTPNVDSIAAAGVRFTNGYVSCPVCSPSRAGLLTGRYQERFGHEMNPGGVDWPNFGLPKDQPALSEVLHAAGYRTGMMGKWHLGNKLDRSPTARGFDEFFGFWGGLHGYMAQSPGWNMIRKGTERVDFKGYLTDSIGEEAAAFIDHNHDKPFFLYVAFNAVHQPLQAPPRYMDRFKDEPDRKRRTMLAMLSALDDAVGKVLDKLREHKLEQNTIIFFLSDNGGPTEGNASSNAPFTGYKNQLFEGGIREPFYVQWKGHVPEGKVRNEPVISLDIFATATALAGAQISNDKPIDGVDLMPWLTGKNDGPVHERLYWRYTPQWAIREGDWKVMGLRDRAKLFNLAIDPREKNDVSAQKPEIFQRLKDDYAAWNKQLIPPLWDTDRTYDMDDQEFDRQEAPHAARERRLGGKPAPTSSPSDL